MIEFTHTEPTPLSLRRGQKKRRHSTLSVYIQSSNGPIIITIFKYFLSSQNPAEQPGDINYSQDSYRSPRNNMFCLEPPAETLSLSFLIKLLSVGQVGGAADVGTSTWMN